MQAYKFWTALMWGLLNAFGWRDEVAALPQQIKGLREHWQRVHKDFSRLWHFSSSFHSRILVIIIIIVVVINNDNEINYANVANGFSPKTQAVMW